MTPEESCNQEPKLLTHTRTDERMTIPNLSVTSEFTRTTVEIYFDIETAEIMRAVLGSVRQMSTSIWLRVPEIFENHGKHQNTAFRETGLKTL
jgi:hypothetical protein